MVSAGVAGVVLMPKFPSNTSSQARSRIGSRSPRSGLTLLLLVAGSVLFALAFPNRLFRFGFFPVAFVALVPVVIAVRRMRWWATPFYGALYGFITYAVFNYWLANFHPLAIFIVPTIYAGYFFVIFPALWIADRTAGRWAWVLQLLIWLAYEYLRTQWYLGYAYGIIGYAVWTVRPLIQIAEIGGVWPVSALVAWPSFYTAHRVMRRGGLLRRAESIGKSPAYGIVRGMRGWLVYAGVLLAVVAYGIVSPVDYADSPTWRVALVQQNVDPWVGGLRAYRHSLDVLIRQSDAALQHDPQAVIWSETSFVPSIDYHTRYREDQERYELVRELTEYLGRQSVPFVVGNSDGRLVRNAQGQLERVDYNAVLVYHQGRIADVYRKIHLVPFTEHFPYQRQLPWLHRMLVENNTNFWETGTTFTVFEVDGVRFSTPICFEDTFGYLSREFVRRGADVIVNLTNDSWAFSEPSAMQHMAMAVFRAVENRRSVVRSTNGGMTTIIDPNGRLLDLYPAFVEGYIVGTVPLYAARATPYTTFGDWFAYAAIGGAIIGFVSAVGVWAVRRRSLTKA